MAKRLTRRTLRKMILAEMRQINRRINEGDRDHVLRPPRDYDGIKKARIAGAKALSQLGFDAEVEEHEGVEYIKLSLDFSPDFMGVGEPFSLLDPDHNSFGGKSIYIGFTPG